MHGVIAERTQRNSLIKTVKECLNEPVIPAQRESRVFRISGLLDPHLRGDDLFRCSLKNFALFASLR
jgi:hypothetical protein